MEWTFTRAGGAVSAEDRRLKMLLVGRTGTGKTYFASSVGREEDGDVPERTALVVLFEKQGYDTVETANPDARLVPGSDGTFVCDLKRFAQLLLALESGDVKTDVLVIDGATELQEMLIEALLRKPDNATSEGNLTIQAWGTVKRKCRNLFRRLRDIDPHVIVLAREDWKTDDDGETKSFPLVSGSFQKDIGGYFNAVGYMYTKQLPEEIGRYVLLGGDAKYNAKAYRELVGVIKPDANLLIDYAIGRIPAADVLLPDAPLPDEPSRRTKSGMSGAPRFGDDDPEDGEE